MEFGILPLGDLQTSLDTKQPVSAAQRIADTIERAGRLGVPMILGYIGGPLSHARQAVDIYREAGGRARHPERLRVGISTHFFAGADPRSAR